MTKTMKRTLTIMLILSMCMVSTPSPSLAEDDVPTLAIFMEACPTVEDYETNATTLWIQEQIGSKLEFILAPSGSGVEKLNILLNGGDYPDLFYITLPDENLYGVEGGILLDLTEYITPEIMPNLSTALEMRPDVLMQIRSVDGKIYYSPRLTETFHVQYPSKMFYNKTLFEELGMDIPTTTDEFYDVLVAFKEKHPEGIPLTGCTDFAANPYYFLGNAWTYIPIAGSSEKMDIRLHNDVMETVVTTEEYREVLRFLNKLYAEKLLDEGCFTMDMSAVKALLYSDIPVLFWPAQHNVVYIDANNPELYAAEKPLEPLTGPNGAQYTSYRIPAAVPGISISKSSAHIEEALRFMDLHYSKEGFWHISSGVEGQDWDWAKEGELTVTGQPAVAGWTNGYITGMQNVKWEPNNVYWQISDIYAMPFDEAAYDEDDYSCGEDFRSIMTKELYEPHYQDEYKSLFNLKFTIDESEEISTMIVTLDNYIAESRVSFITGALSLDDDWDAYVSNIANMGMETVLDIYQTAYDRMAG